MHTLPGLHSFPNRAQGSKPVYPGSIEPLNSYSSSTLSTTQKTNKNNLDINVLANQVSNLRAQELSATKLNDSEVVDNCNNEEIKRLKSELAKANEERKLFQGKLQFQEQVNAELKKLLVASLGEDLETQVNVLTEDKLQLTQELLDTAKHLSTHTEQMEFLAGQCEVWRSKFLASSVMVEELARWKADLTQKNKLLTESTNGLLNTLSQLRGMQWQILQNLKFVNKLRHLNLTKADVVELTAESDNILQQMVLHSGLGVPDLHTKVPNNKESLTDSEKTALQALDYSSQPLMATDEAIRALFGHLQRPYLTLRTTATTAPTASTSNIQQM